MPADPLKISLYSQNTFDVENPNQQQIDAMAAAASNINGSGFGTVLLGQWHVHSDGGIYYNNSPLDTVIQALKVIPTALKLGGSVKKALLSFGPFGSDFQGIKTNLALFKKTIAGVQAMTNIDGLDWDLEQDYEQFTGLLVDLTQWANGLGMMVTAAPYQEHKFWTKVLKQTNTGGSAGFSWWNLQLYGGADYGQWVTYLKGLVPHPEAFLVPGFNVQARSTPSAVQSNLSQLESSYHGLDGGFIWQYENIVKAGYTAAQYANAIAAGLASGKSHGATT
ncbi:MAG TPA: hypothetical protein VIX89_20325 [Bryobacteraceae bacterium]